MQKCLQELVSSAVYSQQLRWNQEKAGPQEPSNSPERLIQALTCSCSTSRQTACTMIDIPKAGREVKLFSSHS